MLQTTDYPIAGAPPLPRRLSAVSKPNLHGIEAAALALMSELSSADLSKIKSIVSQLRGLSGMIGRVGSKAGGLQAMISAAIGKAQRQIAELELTEGRGGSIDPEVKFEMSVYALMSDKAKEFYHEIDADTHYYLAPVNDDGEIVQYAAKKVHGKTLRRLLTLVKFHSFDTASKKKVLEESFGAEAAEGEGTPKDKALLEKKRNELYVVHEALDHLEAYKAYIISRKHEDDIATEMIANNHEIIVRAHDQIDEVIRKYDVLTKDINSDMAMALLKVAKLKMKKMLKEDVINHVLLEIVRPPSISGGIEVPSVAPTTTGVGFDSVPLFFQSFAN